MRNSTKQQILRHETQAKFPYLIEITTELDGVFHYANCDDSIEYEGNVYEGAVFNITPPEENESEIGNGKLTISSIDQQWIEKIRRNKKRSIIRFLACIDYEEGERYIEPIEDTEFKLSLVDWNESTITWTMLFDDDLSILIPCDSATAQTTPALV